MIEIILILHQRMNKLTFLLFLVIFNITYGNIVCPKNSYYKERSYGNNYDKYKLTYYECKKCSPGFVSNTNSTKCTWCPEKKCKVKSTDYCKIGYVSSHNNGCIKCNADKYEYMPVNNQEIKCKICKNGYLLNNFCYKYYIEYIIDYIISV